MKRKQGFERTKANFVGLTIMSLICGWLTPSYINATSQRGGTEVSCQKLVQGGDNTDTGTDMRAQILAWLNGPKVSPDPDAVGGLMRFQTTVIGNPASLTEQFYAKGPSQILSGGQIRTVGNLKIQSALPTVQGLKGQLQALLSIFESADNSMGFKTTLITALRNVLTRADQVIQNDVPYAQFIRLTFEYAVLVDVAYTLVGALKGYQPEFQRVFSVAPYFRNKDWSSLGLELESLPLRLSFWLISGVSPLEMPNISETQWVQMLTRRGEWTMLAFPIFGPVDAFSMVRLMLAGIHPLPIRTDPTQDLKFPCVLPRCGPLALVALYGVTHNPQAQINRFLALKSLGNLTDDAVAGVMSRLNFHEKFAFLPLELYFQLFFSADISGLLAGDTLPDSVSGRRVTYGYNILVQKMGSWGAITDRLAVVRAQLGNEAEPYTHQMAFDLLVFNLLFISDYALGNFPFFNYALRDATVEQIVQIEQIYKGYYGPYFKDLSRLSRADMVRIFKNIWDRIKVIFKTQALDGIGE
ncbi:MAG: hypothetical protein K1X29_05100 [Bdellovibrionales bacterium]|nr:hypothetical protein [Bdellovibrionales bacterium]